MKIRLNIAIDDVNPSPQYRILGTPVEKWLETLHEQFSCKFDIFCPANFHGKWPVSEHRGWVEEIKSIPYLQINAHGFYHNTNNPTQFGECEFFELTVGEEIHDRLWTQLDREWTECGFDISEMGWRSPGWLCSEASKKYIERTFKYVAIHYEHNRGMEWNCKTFFGHDNIQSENIGIHNEDMIMLQSHIAGNHNLNVWNQHNFEQLQITLDHLVNTHEITFKHLKECI